MAVIGSISKSDYDGFIETIVTKLVDVFGETVPDKQVLGTVSLTDGNIAEVSYYKSIDHNSAESVQSKLLVKIFNPDNPTDYMLFSLRRKLHKYGNFTLIKPLVEGIKNYMVRHPEVFDKNPRLSGLFFPPKYTIMENLISDVTMDLSPVSALIGYDEILRRDTIVKNIYGSVFFKSLPKTERDLWDIAGSFFYYKGAIIRFEEIYFDLDLYMEEFDLNTQVPTVLKVSKASDQILPADINRYELLSKEVFSMVNRRVLVYGGIEPVSSQKCILDIWVENYKFLYDPAEGKFIYQTDEEVIFKNYERALIKYLIERQYSISDILADSFKLISIISKDMTFNATKLQSLMDKLHNVYPLENINTDSIIKKLDNVLNAYNYYNADKDKVNSIISGQ
jgi:hypothetical protein